MATETMYLKNGASIPVEHLKPVIFSWEIILKVGAIVSTVVIAMAGGGWLVSPAKTSDVAALSTKVESQNDAIKEIRIAITAASNQTQTAILELRKDSNEQLKTMNDLVTQLRLENTRLATQFKDAMAVGVTDDSTPEVVVQSQPPPKRKRLIVVPPKKRGFLF